MLGDVVNKLGKGFHREYGETRIPMHIWNTHQFQNWYKDLKNAGNRLLDARVLNTYKVWENVFAFALWVKIDVVSEGRIKENEIIFSRPDISTVVAYYKQNSKTYITLIKEFRSNVSNKNGYVLELPGGSSLNDSFTPSKIAQHELVEETGLYIKDVERFKLCTVRQMAATFTTFKNHVYKVELQEDEFNMLKEFADTKKVFGENEEERTQLEIIEMNDIEHKEMDLSVIGSIYMALK